MRQGSGLAVLRSSSRVTLISELAAPATYRQAAARLNVIHRNHGPASRIKRIEAAGALPTNSMQPCHPQQACTAGSQALQRRWPQGSGRAGPARHWLPTCPLS